MTDLADIKRITINPGDRLVFRIPDDAPLDMSQREAISHFVRGSLALDVPVLVLAHGEDISVLKEQPNPAIERVGINFDVRQPFEAVRDDGKVSAVSSTTLPSSARMAYAGRVHYGNENWGWDDRGYPLHSLCRWHLRNTSASEGAAK